MLKVDKGQFCYYVHETNSSTIKSFGFYFTEDDETGEVIDKEWGYLVVNFGNDSPSYYYLDFNVSTFFEMVNSESIGKFFNERVKDVYDCECH